MPKSFILAASAVASVLLFTSGAMAVSVAIDTPPPPPPPVVEDCMFHCGPDDGGGNNGGNGGDITPLTPEEEIARKEEVCNGALHGLRKVSPTQVERFTAEAGVSLVPLCNSGIGHKAALDFSQVAPLLNSIAANPALMGPLKAKGYGIDDVVGLMIGGEQAKLFVHKRS